MGNIMARNNLGCIFGRHGNDWPAFFSTSMAHLRISAAAGCQPSLDCVRCYLGKGYIREETYKEVLNAFLASFAEMKGKSRDEFSARLEKLTKVHVLE
mmetsp:Transcript_7109/g.15531  ORF Transcript_7109/g.15531 Transcript_7109/m.15531 type:complete len:98 (+) Transcript_7109:648-941(+)